jgi:hypothetical protein
LGPRWRSRTAGHGQRVTGGRARATGEGGMGGSDVRPEEGRGFRGAPEPVKPVVRGARAGR